MAFPQSGGPLPLCSLVPSPAPGPRPQARGVPTARPGGAWASCTPHTPAGLSRLLVTESGHRKPHGPLTSLPAGTEGAQGARPTPHAHPSGCQNVPNTDWKPAASGPPTRLGDRSRLPSTYKPTASMVSVRPSSVLIMGPRKVLGKTGCCLSGWRAMRRGLQVGLFMAFAWPCAHMFHMAATLFSHRCCSAPTVEGSRTFLLSLST